MTMTRARIAEILNEAGRIWTPNPPADEVEIAQLVKLAPFELPLEYLELLRYCNGGEGELNAPPLWFQMESIADSIWHNEFFHKQGDFLSFWFIGGNGGLETIGFDRRTGPPWAIVMIDCIAGDQSAERIASHISDFIWRIGLPQQVNEHEG